MFTYENLYPEFCCSLYGLIYNQTERLWRSLLLLRAEVWRPGHTFFIFFALGYGKILGFRLYLYLIILFRLMGTESFPASACTYIPSFSFTIQARKASLLPPIPFYHHFLSLIGHRKHSSHINTISSFFQFYSMKIIAQNISPSPT